MPYYAITDLYHGGKEVVGGVKDAYNGNYLQGAGRIGLGGLLMLGAGAGAYSFGNTMSRELIPAYDLYRMVSDTKLPVEVYTNVGWGPRQLVSVHHLSKTPIRQFRLVNPDLYGVLAEGQSPVGVWFTIREGNPSSIKRLKRARARTTFLTRPYDIQTEVVLDKPMVTVGEVADRGAVDLLALNSGADALVLLGIYDNGMSNTTVMKLYKSPEGVIVLERPIIEYYGPTMGKSYYAKLNPNIVDFDVLAKSSGLIEKRKKLASQFGINFRDFGTDRVPLEIANLPEYKAAIEEYLASMLDLVNRWMNDPFNVGKTLVTSNKDLLDPANRVFFSNEPSIPEFPVFVQRNQSRGFRETPEQLQSWYNSILERRPNIKIDNRFVSDIKNPTSLSLVPTSNNVIIQTLSQTPISSYLSPVVSNSSSRDRFWFDAAKSLDTLKIRAINSGIMYEEPLINEIDGLDLFKSSYRPIRTLPFGATRGVVEIPETPTVYYSRYNVGGHTFTKPANNEEAKIIGLYNLIKAHEVGHGVNDYNRVLLGNYYLDLEEAKKFLLALGIYNTNLEGKQTPFETIVHYIGDNITLPKHLSNYLFGLNGYDEVAQRISLAMNTARLRDKLLLTRQLLREQWKRSIDHGHDNNLSDLINFLDTNNKWEQLVDWAKKSKHVLGWTAPISLGAYGINKTNQSIVN